MIHFLTKGTCEVISGGPLEIFLGVQKPPRGEFLTSLALDTPTKKDEND